MKKAKANPPWWLEKGGEICPACSHTYVYQTEYRCYECDGPVCAFCVEETSEMNFVCPTCIEPVEARK